MIGPPDAERADPHEHVRLCLLDLPPEPLYQSIDVVSSPGGPVGESARRNCSGVAVVIRKRNLLPILRDRIGVKVVVDVHAVDVVPPDDVDDDIHEPVSRRRLPGIEPEKLSVVTHRLRQGLAGVGRRNRTRGPGVANPVGIEPDVEFQPAGVGLGDGKLEGIVGRIRRLSHRAGEIFRPGLEGRDIEGVGRWTNL